MTATVIVAHPYDLSFNHAIYRRTVSILGELGVAVHSHDLYQERFNPVLTREELGKEPPTDPQVLQYTRELMASDLLVSIHPNWWGQPPAILKGYIDRVIRPPHAYSFPKGASGGGLPVEGLKGKVGVLFQTSNTEENRENEYFHDPLASLWERCVFGFCGVTQAHRSTFRVIADSTPEERAIWLNSVETVLRQVAFSMQS